MSAAPDFVYTQSVTAYVRIGRSHAIRVNGCVAAHILFLGKVRGKGVNVKQALSVASGGLRPAVSLESYIGNPVGRYFAGSNSATFWPSDGLMGISLWGHPDERDLELISITMRAGESRGERPHLSVVDLRRLEFLELRVFDKLSVALDSYGRGLGRLLTRRALITHERPTRVILTEFFRSLSPGSSVCSFADPLDAFNWLGVDAGSLSRDLERMPGVEGQNLARLRDLQGFLDRNPGAKAEQAVHHFGVSRRTFQRRLRELGTTFQREVLQSQLRSAKRLMRDTSRPLKWIAVESGFASVQHFSSSFRTHVGVSPGRWRARQDD